MIGKIADAGLDDDGAIVEADDNAAGIDNMIVLEHSYESLFIQRFLKVFIGNQTNI